MKKRIVDLNHDLSSIQENLTGISENMATLGQSSKDNSDELTRLEQEMKQLGVNLDGMVSEFPDLNIYSTEYFKLKSQQIEEEVLKEIKSNMNLLPPLTKLDYITGFLIGLAAAIIDILIVKIPKDINYLGRFEQEGSKFTGWLKSLGIDEDGKLNEFLSSLEDSCKVSYDASTTKSFAGYNREINGFYPKTHRMMSLGHDPFFGLIFGLIDMFNGSITFIDSKGSIHNIPVKKFQNQEIKDMVFAPFMWFGHIVSDLCTRMGLPIPGWGFTQLLQFGKFGDKNRTVADLARWMYLEGYDLRHFLSMSIVPAVIEFSTRLYCKFTSSEEELLAPVYAKNLKEIHNNVRLQKLLFIAHSVAASGNVVKTVMHHGNPMAINIPEILAFTKQSINMTIILKRDKSAEKVIRNRTQIDNIWDELENE